ncbi:MAG: hypothetical protein R6V00_07700 [Candidatus Aminicenantes bacterium]
MKLIGSSAFKKYLLPGFVFQSVVIAGGYGTGRELVEYFLQYGPLGGLLGMFLVTTLIWTLILAVTFEFSRKFKAYDYKSFFKKLLGPFWPSFEVLYLINLCLVLAVIGSAAGIILKDNFKLPYMVGVFLMLISIGFLTFKGKKLIENFLSFWSLVLYLTYAAFFIIAFFKFGTDIQKNLSASVVNSGWLLSGFKYALYNMGIIPAVFFCLTHIKTRKQALSAGFLGGVIGIFPGFLFYMAVLGHYPDILPEAVPAIFVLKKINIPLFMILFQVVLFGTLIETGTGIIHAVNQRIQASLNIKGKKLPQWMRPVIASGLILISIGISTFGLINIIAKGYGSISWGFFAVFVIPLLTLGIYKIIKSNPSKD